MSSRKLFFFSALLLIVGLGSLWSKWNGSAGVNVGDSVAAWSVTFNGSVHGWPAMIGLLCLVSGLVLLVIALIRAVTT
jgi:hypothetical protein